MNGLWITYFVSLGVVILFTALTKLLFTYNGGEEFNITHIIVLDFIAAIPFVGTLEAFILICLIFIGIAEGELEPKYGN
jgi:hypothetical protein